MPLQPPNRNPDESDFISTGVNQTSVLSVGPRRTHKVRTASVGRVCRRGIKTFLLAMLLLALGISRASAVALISDPFPTAAEAANIAALTNQYLQAAASATTVGGWLDASPSGTAADRGQSLLLPSTVLPNGPNLDGPLGPAPPGAPPAGNVIISYSATAVNAIVSFNDGSGNTGTLSAALAQFVAGYGNSDGSVTSFYTFCIDLPHTVSNDQSYAAMPRTNVATAFTNGAEMAYVIDNFGAADLASNPDQAAQFRLRSGTSPSTITIRHLLHGRRRQL